MATWGEFEGDSPELAEFGKARLHGKVAYLATVRQDGSPRVHPVTPIIGRGRIFVFMEPTSPKGHDIRRDGRYALHSLVSGTDGGDGEFIVTGRGALVDDPAARAIAVECASYAPRERYTLFELFVESALSTVYDNGTPVRQRWSEPAH